MKPLLLLVLLIPSGSYAQESAKKVIDRPFPAEENVPLYISYFGNFITHPGAKVGLDLNLFMVEKTKEKRKKVKTIRKVLLATPSLAFYSHKASHSGILTSADLAWRRYSKNLFFREVSIGLGYYQKINSGETWVVDNNGSAVNLGTTSRGYLSPSISLSMGKRINTNPSSPILVFARINSNLLLDYNASLVPELSAEMGVRVPQWGIHRKPTRTIVKRK